MQKLFTFISEHKIAVLAVFFGLFLALLIGFAQLADEVHEGETLWIDKSILLAINGTSNDILNTFFVVVTQLGGVLGVITLTAGLLTLLALRRRFTDVFVVTATVGGASLLNLILKLLFERARPDLWQQLIVETSYSFPSGHAMGSAALALAVMYICRNGRLRWPAIVLGSLYILIIGLSRLYLGVHYPTDILAGWLVSAAWLCVVVLVLHARHLFKVFAKK
jgi:membrane-associated phospholipid phosphatase